MTYSVDLGTFDSIRSLGKNHGGPLRWSFVFTTPGFMRSWYESFKPESEIYLGVITDGDRPVGLAPFLIDGNSASFIGHADICDYLDFTIVPGKEAEVYDAVLSDLLDRGVREFDLRSVRPDSTVLSILKNMVLERGGSFQEEHDGVSLEMNLPGDWDSYLGMLNGKQRHEVRRKMRRLRESAEVHLRVLEDPVTLHGEMDRFIEMFRQSRTDKAAFMNAGMESFFRTLLHTLAEESLLKFYLLELDGSPAGACICFDYNDTVFLYNSGYDPRYGSLSAGLLCKILSIEHSIEAGRGKYDFLKGAEPYKYRLGGREVRLSRIRFSFGNKIRS